MPVLRNDQFNYRDEFEPYFKEPEDIRYRDDAVLGTLVETAAYQRLDRDQLRTMTPRQIDQATRKLRESLEVREHDRTAVDQADHERPGRTRTGPRPPTRMGRLHRHAPRTRDRTPARLRRLPALDLV